MQISINITERFPQLVRQPQPEIRRIAALMLKAAAERYTDKVHTWIDEGKAFTPRTGNLQQGIGWRVESWQRAVIYSQMAYSGDVELGTRSHMIKPNKRKALRWGLPGGGYAFSAGHMHPGSTPYPFMYADQDERKRAIIAAATGVLIRELR